MMIRQDRKITEKKNESLETIVSSVTSVIIKPLCFGQLYIKRASLCTHMQQITKTKLLYCKEKETSVKRYHLFSDDSVSPQFIYLFRLYTKCEDGAVTTAQRLKVWLHVRIICTMPVSTLLIRTKPISVCPRSCCFTHLCQSSFSLPHSMHTLTHCIHLQQPLLLCETILFYVFLIIIILLFNGMFIEPRKRVKGALHWFNKLKILSCVIM